MAYSLRTTLVAYVLLPLLAVVGGVVYLTLFAVERHAEARMQEDMELLARALQPAVSRAIEQERSGALERAMRPVSEFDRIYAAKVYGPDGEVLASVGVPPDDTEQADKLEQIADDGDETGEYSELAGRSVYSYFIPLTGPGGQILALLQVSRRHSDFVAEIRALRWRALFLLLGTGLILGAVVSLGHRRALGRHVEALAADMTRVAQGDGDHRATPRGPAEVVALTESLNEMLDGLDRAQRELAERRADQEALEARVRQAEKIASIGRLARGVAHELGTPLSVIEGRAHRALRREDVPEAVRVTLDEIRREVRRLEQIVRQLLDFARGRQESRSRLIPMEAPARGALASVAHEAQTAGVLLDLAEDPPDLKVHADPVRLEQALVNLLRNAVQATPGGRVELAWEESEEGVRIRVSDDGPGVPEELASKVFEPFFTTKPVGEGTGLGLAVVHGIVEEYGGSIRLASSPLGGSAFVVTLPRAAP